MNLKLAEKIDRTKELSIEELCEKFNCLPEEICLGDYVARNTKDTICPYKVILGFANFENSLVTDLGKLEIVYGKKFQDEIGDIRDMHGNPVYLGINLTNSLVKNTGNLRIVYGSTDFGKQITSLGKIEVLGSNLFLRKTNIVNLGNLQVIDGILDIEKAKIIYLEPLKKVGTLVIGTAPIRDFGDIEEVKNIIIAPTNAVANKAFAKEFKHENGKYIRNLERVKSL